MGNALAHVAERQRAAALAEINKAKTQFFNNFSHEFRTPLTLLLGPLETLLAQPLPPAVYEPLRLIQRNLLRLLRQVNTLLDFSRAEASQLQARFVPTEARFVPTDLARLTVELSSAFRSAVEAAGLHFWVEASPLTEPAYVDVHLWESILFNLLSNALKFTFEVQITVALSQQDRQVVLEVADTGTGIPATALADLFSRFQRVAGARSRTHEGSDIGLALVQELVKLHGGTVAVDSELGQGTSFTVMLPLGAAHLPASQVYPADPAALASAAPHQTAAGYLAWLSPPEVAAEELLTPAASCIPAQGTQPVLLVADDNADMRQYLGHMLSEDYEVRTVADGEQAWEAILASPPSLVLTDVMMPRLDGRQLLAHIRGHVRIQHLPVLLLSAQTSSEVRAAGLEAGADDYLMKPFSVRELRARVQATLELARLRARFETVLSTLRDGFVVVDEHERLTFLNAPAARLLAAPVVQLLGQPWLSSCPPLPWRRWQPQVALPRR